MLSQRTSNTAVQPQTRATLSGLALVVVLLAVLVGLGSGPATAAAADLTPCEKKDPAAPVVERDGELSLESTGKSRKALKRSRLRQSLIKPANQLAGRPAFPVGVVRYGKTARVNLKGGFRIHRKKRRLVVRGLQVVTASGKPAFLKARIGKRNLTFLKVTGGKRRFDAAAGELSRYGTARLTPAAAKLINRKLKTGKRKLRAGTIWGFFNFYSLYKVTLPNENPTGKPPVIAPVKTKPTGTRTVLSATIKWHVRDSWIDYTSSGTWAGDGIRAEDGATPDPPSGPKHLVYSFNFPFDGSGESWTVPSSGDSLENTLIRGKGTVAFRYCANTINFTVSDPEIELDGDSSRLIFRVSGIDGTPFPNDRAVMVKLLPDPSQRSVQTGEGTTTVTWTGIPGFIPAEATGIFAGFYPPYDPILFGEEDPRPDRFGGVTVSYTYNGDATE